MLCQTVSASFSGRRAALVRRGLLRPRPRHRTPTRLSVSWPRRQRRRVGARCPCPPPRGCSRGGVPYHGPGGRGRGRGDLQGCIPSRAEGDVLRPPSPSPRPRGDGPSLLPRGRVSSDIPTGSRPCSRGGRRGASPRPALRPMTASPSATPPHG